MGSCILSGLLDNVVSSYDQNKTTIYGRIAQKTINSVDVLGAPLSKFIDVFSDTGYAPTGPIWVSANNRLYVLLTVLATGAQIAMYNFNPTTGSYTYVGKICVLLPNNPASTYSFKGIRVYNDSTDNSGNWRIFIANTTIIPNGGVFCVNKVDNNDFIPGNIGALPAPANIIPLATGTDQKAVYFMQAPNAMGASHLFSVSAGISLEYSTNKIWVHQGLAASHNFSSWNAAVASLVLPTYSVNLNAATPCTVTHNAHPFQVNDQVIFTGGTMPFTTLALNTVYYIRNPLVNSYELAATVGGASISTTGGSPYTATISRAHGQTSSGFISNTSILPALAGVLLLTDSEQNAVPTNSPINGAVLNGQSCVSYATTTNLYLGKCSELASNTAMFTGGITVGVPGIVTHV